MQYDDPTVRRPQEPRDSDPERSVAAPPIVWIMLGLVAVVVFTVVVLLMGGQLG